MHNKYWKARRKGVPWGGGFDRCPRNTRVPSIPRTPYDIYSPLPFLAFHLRLFKVIQEGGNAFQGRFALAFNLYLELDARPADAPQVLYAVERRHQTNA